MNTHDLLTLPHFMDWVLSPLLGIYTLLFILRIVLTWYPQAKKDKFPFNLVVAPTEFLLIPVRAIIPPLGGVDISPIIWVGIITFLREILLGQQGLLRLMA
jgi:YggT family protein